MSLKKQFSKTKPVCKVTFCLPENVKDIKSVHLLGDFNNWNNTENPLKKTKEGKYSTSVELPTGREYQFRYLLDGIHWENDMEADKHVPTVFGNSENSVIVL